HDTAHAHPIRVLFCISVIPARILPLSCALPVGPPCSGCLSGIIPTPCRCGRPLPLPTPPGSRFAAHAPVARVHPADGGCGSRIFPKQAVPPPLEGFGFPHGDRR